MTQEELPRSVRYLNYAKAFGALMTAVIAIVAFLVANWFPPEPVAKAGYQETEKTIQQLSGDVRRAFETQEMLNVRIDALQEQQRILMEIMQLQIAGLRRPQREQLQKQSQSLKPKTSYKDVMKSSKLEKLLRRPPQRSLPSLNKLQQQIQQQAPLP